jgi:hypothetical protein
MRPDLMQAQEQKNQRIGNPRQRQSPARQQQYNHQGNRQGVLQGPIVAVMRSDGQIGPQQEEQYNQAKQIKPTRHES